MKLVGPDCIPNYFAAIGDGTTNVEPASPFTRVDLAVEDVARLSCRLEALADRLTGTVPAVGVGGTDGLQCVSAGLFEQLGAQATRILNEVSAAHDALNRIERALP